MSADIVPSGALVYLATPFSLLPDLAGAHRQACHIAGLLMRTGLHVFAPIPHTYFIARHGHIDPLDRKFWLDQNEIILRRCDVLIVAHIDGFDKSMGIAHEVAAFMAARKPIFDLDPPSMTMTKRKPAPPARERYEAAGDNDFTQAANTYLGSAP